MSKALDKNLAGFPMLLGSLFLLVVGAGAWSLDAAIQRRLEDPSRKGRP